LVDVYYGATEDHPFRILQEPLEPLLTSYKEGMASYDALGSVTSCPSMIRFMRNRFVIKAPVDITVYQNSEGIVVAYNESSVAKELIGAFLTRTDMNDPYSPISQQTLQMLDNDYLLFVSDTPLEMEITPPFLHNSPMFGIAGSFDIGRWVRPVSFASIYLKGVDKTYIKRGDPIMYVKFMTEEKVNLHRSYVNSKVLSITRQCVNLKKALPKQSLSKQYELADNISAASMAIKEMQSCQY
jgi:hypothetical protein